MKEHKILHKGKFYDARICIGDGVVEVLDEDEKIVGKYAVKHSEMPILPADNMDDIHAILNAATHIGINHIFGNDWKFVDVR